MSVKECVIKLITFLSKTIRMIRTNLHCKKTNKKACGKKFCEKRTDFNNSSLKLEESYENESRPF